MSKKINTSLKSELQDQMKAEDYLKLVERLNLATHAAQMGIWDWDIQKNELVWDNQMYKLYGLQVGGFGGAYEAWLNGIHPDDRVPSNEASQQAVRGEKEYDTEFRVLWPDGSVHWLKANGQVFRDEKGNPLRMVGVNYDITARKQAEIKLSESEQKFSSLFNKSVYATTLSRLPDGVLVDVNEAFEQDFGYTRQEAIGKTSLELGFNPDAEGRARILAEIKEHGSARNHELSLRTKSNETRIFSVNIDMVDIDGQKYILNTSKDITEQKQAEKQIIQMKRLYATLSQVNQTIVRVKDHADLYQSICDVSTKFGEFALAWIGILNAETGEIKPVAASGLDLEQWPFPQVNIHKGDLKNGLAATAMRTSKVVTSDDVAIDERTKQSQASIVNYGYHSTAIVPFQLRGATIGILSLVSKEAELFRAQDEILLLKEMGGDISFALDAMETEAEHRRAEEKIEKQNGRLTILRKIDLAILSADSLESIVSAALDHIRELINCRRANLTLIDRKTDELVIFEVSTVGETSIPAGRRLPLAQFEDIIQTLSQNQPIVFSDYRTMADPRPGVQSLMRDGLLSTCSLPLLSKGGLIGMFSMHSDIPGFFDEGKIALGSEVANQVAIAIVQMQLTEALTKNEERLRLSMHAAKQGLYDLNVQTGESIVNREYAEMLGYDPESFTETNAAWIERLHPDDQVITAKAYTDYINGLLPEYRVEFRQKTKQGDWKWILSLGSIVEYDAEGKPLRMMGTHTDINERKEAEKQIVQMKRLYATLSQVNQTIVRVKDHADLYQSICDVSTKFGEFALAWIGLLNVETGDITPVAASGLDLAHWPFPQVNIHEGAFKNGLVATAMRTSKVVTSDDIAVDERTKPSKTSLDKYDYHSAAIVPFQLRGTTIGILSLVSNEVDLFNAQDEILLLKEMGGDISFALDMMATEAERRQTEDALKESETRFSKVFFTNPVSQSILSTITGQTVEVNDACCRLYEYSHEELIGTDPETLDLWANRAERLDVLEELQRTGRLLPREVTIRPRSGQIRTILFSVEQISWKGEPCLITSSVDISERKLAEQKLSDSEVLLRQVLESVPDSTFALNRDYRLLINNQRHQQELIASGGHPFVVGEQMLSPDYPAEVMEFWRAAYERALNGEIFSLESSWVDTNGQLHVHENMYSPLRDANGAIIGALVVAHDITQRKQAENALREREQKLNAILNLLPVGVSILDQDKKVAYSNDALRKILGITKEGLSRGEYQNRKYLRADGSKKPPEEFASARVFTENIEIHDVITGIVKEDDQTIWTSVSAVPVDFPDWKVILVTSDITERKQAEHEIQRQIQRLKGLHTIDQAISSSMDLKESINIILQQTLDLLKLDASMVLLFDEKQQTLYYAAGKGFRTDAITQSQIDLGLGLAGEVALTRKLLHVPNLPQIGEKFLRAELLKEDQFVEYFGVPLIAKGELKGVLEVFNRTTLDPDLDWLNYLETLGGQAAIAIDSAQLFDNLQRSNAELEQRVRQRTSDLLRVNTELEHANSTKDEFLANMSHELRTPLTGILGLTESLQLSTYGELNERQLKVLNSVETSGRHLLELINDILDLSKIEAGKFDIYPEMLNIEDICKASLIFVKEQSHKKSILLEYQDTKDAKSVLADSRRLKQILVNLLSNAVKFTPEKGKVTLAVRADSEKGQIHFSVRDTGIGITKEDMDRLFTPFTQVDSRLNRQYEGTGLGLVLVLRLAEMHGGNVQVETEPGKGSCFTVSLPWQTHVNTSIETNQIFVEASADPTPKSHGVLLLVEDNVSNVETIGDYLQFKGYTLVIASNGIEALTKAEESSPNLILMDVQMPVMDGLETMRRLRADPRFISTPIIALTALAMTGDRDRCLEAGADDYLSKPVSLTALVEKIEKLLHQ